MSGTDDKRELQLRRNLYVCIEIHNYTSFACVHIYICIHIHTWQQNSKSISRHSSCMFAYASVRCFPTVVRIEDDFL